MKRIFDLVFSTLGMIVMTPVFAIVSILIKRNSPGPVIYRQERVGRNAKLFRIHKFRTMTYQPQPAGPAITIGNDQRVTSVGVVLRKYRIDELPQLIDVIKGDMSLVGPRPEVPEYVQEWPPDARSEILSIRPGITDPAAIAFIDEASYLAQFDDPIRAYIDDVLPRKVAMYRNYVRTQTLWGDVRIIVQTLKAAATRS